MSMFDLKTIKRAIDQVSEEKGIDVSKVLEAIESSIAAAYKKEYAERGEIIKAKFDVKSGDLKFWQVKTVVDESTVRIVEEEEEAAEGGDAGAVTTKPTEKNEKAPAEVEVVEDGEELLPRYNPARHIFLDEAKKIKKGAKLEDELEFPLETHEDFGRIAAQTAKQVILQKLREAERESVLAEFQHKEGEIVSGIIQRLERGNIYIDLGRATGIMFYNESIPGEHYRIGERMRFYVMAVQQETKIPGIILSRFHPNFVSRLFALEVPEINDETVEIKEVAREAGSRTKIAAISKMDGVDPVGSLVGQRGTRVMAVSNELGNEKIDIIEWSDDPAKFIANALSPAKVKGVEILPRREARVYLPDDQLSLAIGKGGQNVRLAAKLTGWKIDIRSQAHPEEVQDGGIAAIPTEEGAAPASPDGNVEVAADSADEGKKETKAKEKESEE
ncbi:MAG: transcription termination factor NusA [bacterium]|nr:transcription termination factor NusA [bacterium]